MRNEAADSGAHSASIAMAVPESAVLVALAGCGKGAEGSSANCAQATARKKDRSSRAGVGSAGAYRKRDADDGRADD